MLSNRKKTLTGILIVVVLIMCVSLLVAGESPTRPPVRPTDTMQTITLTHGTLVKIIGILGGAVGTWSIGLIATIRWLINRAIQNLDNRLCSMENGLKTEQEKRQQAEKDIAKLDSRYVKQNDYRQAIVRLDGRIDQMYRNGDIKSKLE